MHTDLTATNALAFQIMNHTDESIVRERVFGTESDRMLWFDEEDAQALITDLFAKNFRKLLTDIKTEGQVIKLQ
jgi:hypothetical protein